jgi:hypothetical protein
MRRKYKQNDYEKADNVSPSYWSHFLAVPFGMGDLFHTLSLLFFSFLSIPLVIAIGKGWEVLPIAFSFHLDGGFGLLVLILI